MGAGNRDAALQAHQLGQHDGARHHRNALFTRLQHLRVVGLHGRRGDHAVHVLKVGRIVAHEGADAQALQAAQAVVTASIAEAAQAAGLSGPKIGDKIHAARVQALQAWIESTAAQADTAPSA